MSAFVSSVNVVAVSGRRVGAPSSSSSSSSKRSTVRVRAFDKLKDFKMPDGLPKMPTGMPNFGGGDDDSSSSKAAADIGYDPAGGEEYYVGQGKYIEDDKNGFVSKTGRDSQLVGGFAGGEQGLWKYRDILSTDSRLTPTKATVYGGRVGSDVDLSKDFGGMVGGFPGGEIGVKSFNATGEVATRDAPPTIGWGPPVLLLVAIGAAGYYLNPGDPAEEIGAVVNTAVGAKNAVDSVLTPEQELAVAEVGAAGVGIVLAGATLTAGAKKAGAALDKAIRVGLLGTGALAVAGKILNIF